MSHRLLCLTTWSPAGDAVLGGCAALGARATQEEVNWEEPILEVVFPSGFDLRGLQQREKLATHSSCYTSLTTVVCSSLGAVSPTKPLLPHPPQGSCQILGHSKERSMKRPRALSIFTVCMNEHATADTACVLSACGSSEVGATNSFQHSYIRSCSCCFDC